MNKIYSSFITTLTKNDWDKRLKGWRCSALVIPGALIKEVRDNNGIVRASKDYEISSDLQYIIWRSPDSVNNITVVISLTKKLTTQKILFLWQFITGIATIMSLIIGIYASDMVKKDIEFVPYPSEEKISNKTIGTKLNETQNKKVNDYIFQCDTIKTMDEYKSFCDKISYFFKDIDNDTYSQFLKFKNIDDSQIYLVKTNLDTIRQKLKNSLKN